MNRKTAILIFVILIGYSLIFDCFQIGKQEAKNAFQSLLPLKQYIGKNDLILVPRYNQNYLESIFPIQFIFNDNIFIVAKTTDIKPLLTEYYSQFASYENIFILSPSFLTLKAKFFTPITTIYFQYTLFPRTFLIPSKNLLSYSQNFYLYKINKDQIH